MADSGLALGRPQTSRRIEKLTGQVAPSMILSKDSAGGTPAAKLAATSESCEPVLFSPLDLELSIEDLSSAMMESAST